MLDRDTRDRLRRGYASAPDCPPPEVFLAPELDALTVDERERLLEHAADCVRCSAERALAQEFDDAARDNPGEQDDVARVVAQLRNPVVTEREDNVRAFAPRRARRLRWNVALAAAAVVTLVMVGSVLVRQSSAPILPPPPQDVAVRGSRVEVDAPVGDVNDVPVAFEWQAIVGADRYRVTLLEVDDTVLLDVTTPEAGMSLPADVGDKLSAAVVYVWQVEALDTDGRRVAWSEATRFKIAPRGEE